MSTFTPTPEKLIEASSSEAEKYLRARGWFSTEANWGHPNLSLSTFVLAGAYVSQQKWDQYGVSPSDHAVEEMWGHRS